MARPNDDLDAVRIIADVLKPFDAALQRRILRWAAEKLDLPLPATGEPLPGLEHAPATGRSGTGASSWLGPPVKAFVAAKRPRNDTEFAATVTYFAQHVAPAAARAAGIKADDLVAACAAAGRRQPPVPGQTLRNARSAGILTSRVPGVFSVSRAGERLVTKTLPRDNDAAKVRALATTRAAGARRSQAGRRH